MRGLSSILAGLFLAAVLPSCDSQTGAPDPCALIGEVVQREVAADPDQAQTIVEEAVRNDDVCAWEIVQGAIRGYPVENDQPVDADTVQDIVFAAVTAEPGMAATIAEAAVAVAPHAAEEIKAALEAVLVQD